MDEASVLYRVGDWLERQDHRISVHDPNRFDGHSRHGDIVERWRTHDVAIDRHHPDILGFTPADRVFAVEVDGDENVREGIGRATLCRRGVDHAYLAGPGDAIGSLTNVLQASDIGVLAVDEKTVTPTHPPTVELRDQSASTRQRLSAVLAAGPEGEGTFLPNYADPLNNLLPVVAVASHGCDTLEKIDALCERTEYPYRAKVNRMARLARRLGLVTRNEPLELTQQGELGWVVLRGSGLETASDLIAAKQEISGRLAGAYPAVATFLRNCFAAVPAYGTLFELLSSHPGPAITLQQLCKRLILNYPMTFFDLVYSDYSDDRDAASLVDAGQSETIYSDTAYLSQILNTNFTFNLAAQLRSIGVLSEGTDVVDNKADLSPASDQWVIGDFESA